MLLPTNILFEIKDVLLSHSSINQLRNSDTNVEEFEPLKKAQKVKSSSARKHKLFYN